jgi:hypothetical protein
MSSSDAVTGHLTLALPMRSPADGQALSAKVPGVMPAFSKAADAAGTLHYCRLIAVDATNFYFIAEYDGELEAVLRAMASQLGPVMDEIFRHVDAPPPMPVSRNVDAFVEWAVNHQISPFMAYESYPGVSVQEIRSRANAAGVAMDETGVQQRPLLVIMPMKGRLAVAAVRMAFSVLQRYLQKGGDEVGTVHFAHLVPLPNNQIGFFTVYDGPFEKYAQDFAEKLGPAFDLLFKFIIDPAATPTSKNAAAFTKWVEEHDLRPIGFYSAYPGLQVQDIRELLNS